MIRRASEAGFTMIELMVSLVVVAVILGGLYGNFVMQSRVQASQASAGESAEDLRLASQIMSAQLKLAANICWDATNGLVYQPLGAPAMTACAGSLDPHWGAFSFSSSGSTGGRLWWLVPGNASKQEVLRGLDSNTGFTVSPQSDTDLGVLRSITLVSQYQDADRQNRGLSVRFDVLPRNH